MALPEILVFHLSQLLLLFPQLLRLALVVKRIPPFLFLLHDGRFEGIFLRVLAPTSHLGLHLAVVFHPGLLALLDSLFLREFLPFGWGLLLRQALAPGQQSRALRKFEIEPGEIEVMDLLFLRQRLNGKDLLFLGIDCSLVGEIDVLDQSVSKGLLQDLGVVGDGGGVVEGEASEVNLLIGFHWD